MDIDLDHLREYYASLSDGALAQIRPADLVDAARDCYLQEAARRRPVAKADPEPTPTDDYADESAWLADAAVAAGFTQFPGQAEAPEAARACAVLRDAGIPCAIVTKESEPDQVPRTLEYEVMVPGALVLPATSILDRDMFNEDLEHRWRAHFSDLTDRDLLRLVPEVFNAGMLDRVERLTRAYREEVARRRPRG